MLKDWKHYDKIWKKVPENDEAGLIEYGGNVLTFNAKGGKVVLKAKSGCCDEQNWLRSPITEEGWFTLKNVKSGRFLTAGISEQLTTTMTGNYITYNIPIFIRCHLIIFSNFRIKW